MATHQQTTADRRRDLRRRAARLRMPVRAIVITLSLTMITVIGPSGSVDAAEPPESACPEMTDSIRRLYKALFLREPNLNEAFHWTEEYKTGRADLPTVANQLIRSNEFTNEYGQRSSSDFVELIYRNTRQPMPSAEVRGHWARALNTGYSRGEMALALTESEEFVRRTATTRPLSGYLRWYPPGSHWYCGRGTIEGLGIKPLSGDPVFADRLVKNEGDTADDVIMVTIEQGMANAVMVQTTLGPRVTDYSWMGNFAGDGYYGGALTVVAAPTTRWIAVFYSRPIGHSRLGWQIDPAMAGTPNS